MPTLAGEATYIGPEWLWLVSKIGIIVRLLLLIIKSYLICFFGFFVFVLVVVYLFGFIFFLLDLVQLLGVYQAIVI